MRPPEYKRSCPRLPRSLRRSSPAPARAGRLEHAVHRVPVVTPHLGFVSSPARARQPHISSIPARQPRFSLASIGFVPFVPREPVEHACGELVEPSKSRDFRRKPGVFGHSRTRPRAGEPCRLVASSCIVEAPILAALPWAHPKDPKRLIQRAHRAPHLRPSRARFGARMRTTKSEMLDTARKNDKKKSESVKISVTPFARLVHGWHTRSSRSDGTPLFLA